ncbi:MAG: DUF1684 domain-containing protein [Anaerolineaceae bacterium]|nr:DUF1684 domain-containing protein [Anaerolineaceae bacterium]
MNKLKRFRKDKNHFFASDHHSPLSGEQQQAFTGLHYFAENPDLHFEVTVEEYPDKQEIQMQTSTGGVQSYQRYGRLRFTVEGQEAELTLYASEDSFFLPFVDALAGKETYGAGRYLDPIQSGDGKFLIDFNYAYNPYCAYNDLYTCPLTPWENRLKVPMRAGEKIPQGRWVDHEELQGIDAE